MFGTLPKDIVILVTSENATDIERRVTPSWTISILKTKLEPVTGIPPASQRLLYSILEGSNLVALEGLNEDVVQISELQWQNYARLVIEDTRPLALRENFTDITQVKKYEMPEEDYVKLSDSVLAWKKRNQLGRFDPKKTENSANKQTEDQNEVDEREIKLGARCLVGDTGFERRGNVAYVGQVDKIPQGGIWVGVRLDEPTGKNDGSIEGTKYFDAGANHGIFVRPSRVTIGDYPPKSFDDEDILEEI